MIRRTYKRYNKKEIQFATERDTLRAKRPSIFLA